MAPNTTNPAAIANISSVKLVPASVHTLWLGPLVWRPVRTLPAPNGDTLLAPNKHWIGSQGADPYFTLVLAGRVDCASLNQNMS